MEAQFVSKPDGRGWNKPVVTVQSQAPSKDNSVVNTSCLRAHLATPRLTSVPCVRSKLEGTGQNLKSSDKLEQVIQKATKQLFLLLHGLLQEHKEKPSLVDKATLAGRAFTNYSPHLSPKSLKPTVPWWETDKVKKKRCDSQNMWPQKNSVSVSQSGRTGISPTGTRRQIKTQRGHRFFFSHFQNTFQILLLSRTQVSFERFLFFTTAENALLIRKACYYYKNIIIIIISSNKE